ncbi:MAG: hypothetical protein QOE54_4550 [Streptosporangiaceae bacterium]|jgi:hypothetical protein|nr:hypothetical protein [Streptosporangiaceae bacterium]MDX6432184.1 hypothetical protein [Streptosporangiaceae bacterium]
MSAEELLQTSPFEGDLDRELAARPPRRTLPGATAYLGAGVLLVAGFAGGVQADKQWGSKGNGGPGGAGLPAAAGGFGAGQRAGGFGRQQGGQAGALPGGPGAGGPAAPGGTGGAATFGTVKLVDGKTIYVQTTSGGVVQVATDGSTKIRVSKNGTVKDLAPGSTVMVQGAPGKDGTVKATSINQAGGLSGGSAGGGRGGN